jgi:ATP-dependent helicase/nuclease subunit A
MGNVKYTKEQEKVIYTRNRNLLVSAAAGSGKTAVLVERIIQLIIDKEKPINIDKLLVVTFTNAAASEMRERIGNAIEKKLEEEPENKYLHRQLTLLPSANIMTIHAFCLNIIRNYFHVIDLDPSFRIGDETELKLLKNDAIKELLEEKYEENSEEFLELVESYSTGKTDELIEELITNVHNFSMSNPWPFNWLDIMVEKLNIKSTEELSSSIYYSILIDDLNKKVEYIEQILLKAKRISQQEEGPDKYIPVIENYLNTILNIKNNISSIEKIYETISMFTPIRLSSATKGIDKQLKEEASKLINYAKDELRSIKTDYFLCSPKESMLYIEKSYSVVKTLVQVVKEFTKKFNELKEEKNIIDFNDIEHYALNILVGRDEEGNIVQSDISKEYMNMFEEILIDEYQDSNLVQESILKSVSKEWINEPNIFMVGDIKQSIYKFRLAKPELFMNKYNTYSEEDSKYQKIDLQKNFRSRKEVIDCINFLFKQLMSKEIGDVTYNKKVSLNLGANYEYSSDTDYATEVFLIDKKLEEGQYIGLDDKQLEGKLIGLKIKELINSDKPFIIFDKSTGEYRPIKYKDITIILRTTTGWIDTFIDELKKLSIPVYSETTTGYFDTVEIKTIVNLLKIIDNPLQDIPLLSVLRSPIVGLRGEELVQIRKAFDEGEFYTALTEYVNIYEENELIIKVNEFLNKLNNWRIISKYTPIDELILKIYEDTNYYYYISLMKGGRQRQANLDLFIDKASSYEKSSYKGLFNFIRYVDNIEKHSIDYGQASSITANDNMVNIMSIHKSKGLEFPVVFVAGLGKNFNMTDMRKSVILHQDLGFGVDYVNYIERYKMSTLPKNVIKNKIKIELLSEELRVLYVALTRAREKIILVGSAKDIEKKSIKWCEALAGKETVMPSNLIEQSNSYLEWIMYGVVRHNDGKLIRDLIDRNLYVPIQFSDDESKFALNIINVGELLKEEEEKISDKENILNILLEDIDENINYNIYNNKLCWEYEYNSVVGISVNKSVSEIKRIEEKDLNEIDYKEDIKLIPKFIEDKQDISGSHRGTIFHKILYYIDLDIPAEYNTINSFIDKLVDNGIISAKEKAVINVKSIINFLNSSVAKRMKCAKKYNKLVKEKPFVLGIEAKEIYDHVNSEEIIMIQGVIDVYFEEDEDIVLLDYKTDYLVKEQEQILINRYKKQMEYYKRAIEQVTKKKVKEVIIYSLSASREVIIEHI